MLRIKSIFSLLLLSLIFIISSTSVLAWDKDMEEYNAGRSVPVYRLYNNQTGEHLYTANTFEYDSLKNLPSWNGEGVGWNAPEIGDSVFRCYNKVTSFHLYSTNTNELEALMYNCTSPWVIDNKVGTYAYPVFYSGGPRMIYRLYNPNADQHLFTTNLDEYNMLAHIGWAPEGIAFSALS